MRLCARFGARTRRETVWFCCSPLLTPDATHAHGAPGVRDGFPRRRRRGSGGGAGDLRSGGGNHWAPLRRNLPLLASHEVELAKLLLSEGQSHLFEHWPEPGVDDDKKRNFFDQANILIEEE